MRCYTGYFHKSTKVLRLLDRYVQNTIMKLYRITQSKYASDLNGTGGLYGPARWNREGTRVVYLAEHVSLAKLEVLANSRKTPKNQTLVCVELPDEATITYVERNSLPAGWEKIPYLDELADITERWLREQTFWVVRVPSAHSPNEYNFLLNPLHPEHRTLQVVSIEPHPFDPRLK